MEWNSWKLYKDQILHFPCTEWLATSCSYGRNGDQMLPELFWAD